MNAYTSDNQVQSMICRVAGASISALWGDQTSTFFSIKFEIMKRETWQKEIDMSFWLLIKIMKKGMA